MEAATPFALFAVIQRSYADLAFAIDESYPGTTRWLGRRMISGCQDKQTSADVSNVSSFQLPDPAGTSAASYLHMNKHED